MMELSANATANTRMRLMHAPRTTGHSTILRLGGGREGLRLFLAARPTIGRMPEPAVVVEIGEIALPSRCHILRVALVDWGNDFGIGIDVRVFVTDAAHDRRREARARAAMNGRRWRGAYDSREFFTGPTRRGLLLQPGAAEELAELLALAVVKAEAIAAEAG